MGTSSLRFSFVLGLTESLTSKGKKKSDKKHYGVAHFDMHLEQ